MNKDSEHSASVQRALLNAVRAFATSIASESEVDTSPRWICSAFLDDPEIPDQMARLLSARALPTSPEFAEYVSARYLNRDTKTDGDPTRHRLNDSLVVCMTLVDTHTNVRSGLQNERPWCVMIFVKEVISLSASTRSLAADVLLAIHAVSGDLVPVDDCDLEVLRAGAAVLSLGHDADRRAEPSARSIVDTFFELLETLSAGSIRERAWAVLCVKKGLGLE